MFAGKAACACRMHCSIAGKAALHALSHCREGCMCVPHSIKDKAACAPSLSPIASNDKAACACPIASKIRLHVRAVPQPHLYAFCMSVKWKDSHIHKTAQNAEHMHTQIATQFVLLLSIMPLCAPTTVYAQKTGHACLTANCSTVRYLTLPVCFLFSFSFSCTCKDKTRMPHRKL